MRRLLSLLVGAAALVIASAALAQQALVIRPLAEREVWLFTLGSAGGSSPGGTKVLVSSSSASELQSLVRFLVDATQPFSSPASLP